MSWTGDGWATPKIVPMLRRATLSQRPPTRARVSNEKPISAEDENNEKPNHPTKTRRPKEAYGAS
jgi:hypothetical protein